VDALLVSLAALVLMGCSSLPRPAAAPPLEASFVDVLGPPPPARPEIMPKRPDGPVVWVDGAWSWEGARWRWIGGGWFVPPPGSRYADWATRRRPDGELRYANPQWLDASGAPIPAPPKVEPSAAIGGTPSPDKP
jgi:hypothetical protein